MFNIIHSYHAFRESLYNTGTSTVAEADYGNGSLFESIGSVGSGATGQPSNYGLLDLDLNGVPANQMA